MVEGQASAPAGSAEGQQWCARGRLDYGSAKAEEP